MWSWKILQWSVAFALVVVGIGIVYYFAPDAEQMWVWVTPGSLVATLLWLIGSIGFRFYAVNFANYQATYGAVGGVILLLLWFYLSGLVFVIGAEMKEDRARLALGQGAGREGAGRQGATVGLIIGASMQAWLRPDR